MDSLKRYRPEGDTGNILLKKFLYAYHANMSFTDWNVGRVIEALDSSRYADNTIVIVCSDNGYHCGEKERWGKATLWEQADYVPLLIRTPHGATGECTRTVSLLDIYPTLIDWCNLDKPSHTLDGKSMAPLLKDIHAEWDRPSFTSYGIEYSSVRDERFRYIRYPDGEEELYDHKVDPFEFNNVAGNTNYKEVIDRLSEEIPEVWKPSVGGRLEVSRK